MVIHCLHVSNKKMNLRFKAGNAGIFHLTGDVYGVLCGKGTKNLNSLKPQTSTKPLTYYSVQSDVRHPFFIPNFCGPWDVLERRENLRRYISKLPSLPSHRVRFSAIFGTRAPTCTDAPAFSQ